MLRLLVGPAGTGKTARIMGEITKRVNTHRKQLLIVPEQYSHAAERALCFAAGEGVSLYAEVFSFTSLARRVFSLAGGAAAKRLDKVGRLLLMHQAVDRLKDNLEVYRLAAFKPELLQVLIDAADELTACGATPEMLMELSGSVDFPEKLTEISIIIETWKKLIGDTGIDPADTLIKAKERLSQCDFGKDCDVYIDSFTDFTAPERDIINLLLTRADNVTVAFTCDTLMPDGAGAFDVVRAAAAELISTAEKLRIKTEIVRLKEPFNRPRGLASLSTGLFDSAATKTSGKSCVRIIEAETFLDECRVTASRILSLVREGKCRFNEVGIALRDVEGKKGALESIFSSFGIPLYISGRSDILSKAVPAFVLSALDTVTGGFLYEDIFKYIKTGLAGLTADESDRLENYVLKWNIRGSMWYRDEPWEFNPDGFDAQWTQKSREKLDAINALRERVRKPLNTLRNGMNTAVNGEDYVKALYEFLTETGLSGLIEERAENYRSLGELKAAEEYSQLWALMIGILDQMYDALGKTKLDRKTFARLFAMAVGCCDVGSIPASLDTVGVRELREIGHGNLKYLFLMGADDTQLPYISQPQGIFSDFEREELRDLGLKMMPGGRERLGRELYAIYSAVTEPEKGLNISYSRSGEQGQALRAAFIIRRICELLPDVETERIENPLFLDSPVSCLEAAAEALGGSTRPQALAAVQLLSSDARYSGKLQAIAASCAKKYEGLGLKSVKDLYGRRLNMSASRIDKFFSCHFSYFMQYGLKAKPRKPAGFEAPEMGTFVHYILEHVLKSAESGGGIKSLTDEQIQDSVKFYVNQYIHVVLNDFKDKTPRFRYLFTRLIKNVTAIVMDMAQELRVSEFRPMKFELEFGDRGELPPVALITEDGEIKISGFVDRIDGWEKDGKLYLRVVDYKTGRKSFDFTDILNGIGLQMLIYLFALGKGGEDYFHKPIVPSGVLYIPARDVLIQGSRSMGEEERVKKVSYELRRKGVILDDEAVLRAMESSEGGEIHYLPVKLDKNGNIVGSALLSAEKLGRLERHVDTLLKKLTHEIYSGSTELNPYRKGAYVSCDHCDYAAVCHFSDAGKPRKLEKVSDERFWELVGGEER